MAARKLLRAVGAYAVLAYADDTQHSEETIARKAIEANPSKAYNHGALCNALIKKQKVREAEKACKKAISLDPEEATYHNSLGILYNSLKRFDDAEEYYRSAVNLDPQHSKALTSLGKILKDKGDYPAAAEVFKQATDASPRRAGAWSQLAELQEEAGDLKAAEKYYKKALKADKRFTDAHVKIGDLQVRQGDNEGAEKSFRHAVKINPASSKMHVKLGLALKKAGDRDGAKKAFEKGKYTDEKSAEPYFALGELSREDGENTEAVDNYKAGLQKQINHVDTYHAWKLLAARMGKVEDATNVLKMRRDVVGKMDSHGFRMFLTSPMDSDDEINKRVDMENATAHRFASMVGSAKKKTGKKADKKKDKKKDKTADKKAEKKEDEKQEGKAKDDIPDLATIVQDNDNQRAAKFPAALNMVRRLENVSTWTERRWEECLPKLEETEVVPCEFGITWFHTLLRVFEHPSLRAGLIRRKDGYEQVTVGGSGAGYQCFFAALGLGLPCVGFDLLCQAHVADPAGLGVQMGLTPESEPSVKFNCEDVATGDHSRTGLLWLNDANWPEEYRTFVLDMAVPTMPVGANIVSYNPWPEGAAKENVVEEGIVTAEVSWARFQDFHIFTLTDGKSAPSARSEL
eukprot:TRINITY_DN81955_c0_g1_i1.p1 TRINITY_DN81955_c0_g1~~TRINITY_DN81955_c0_g1_i1.p1  ORF type:complete len:656 (+),score=173.09 TRINITY_DN81955_c0_g1_i1:78-1970(+)